MTGLSINKYIYTILKDDAELLTMCKNIYPVIAEEDVKYPFILFTRTGVEPIDSKAYVVGDRVSFTIAIVNDRYMLGVDIAERVRELFEKRRDSYFSEINFTGCDEEFNQDAFVQRLNFVATILNKQ